MAADESQENNNEVIAEARNEGRTVSAFCVTLRFIEEWEKLEKISAWDLTKVRNKSEVIDEARTKGIKVQFASLMDLCHLKNANWRQSTINTKVESYCEVTL